MCELDYIKIKKAAVLRASRIVGGYKVLAEKIGASIDQIGYWINDDGPVPYDKAILIEEATAGQVTVEQCCPGEKLVNQVLNKRKDGCKIYFIPIEDIQLPTLPWQQASPKEEVDITTYPPIIITADRHLLAFPERYEAYKEAGDNKLPAIIIDVDQHLENRRPLDVLNRLCPISQRAFAGGIIYAYVKLKHSRPLKKSNKWGSCPIYAERSADRVAELVGLGSRRTLLRVKNVCCTQHNELITAMDNGDLSISLAAKIADKDLQVQRDLLAYTSEELSAYFACKSSKSDKTAISIQKQNLQFPVVVNCYQLIDIKLKDIKCLDELGKFQRIDLPVDDADLSHPLIIDTDGVLISGKSLYLAHQRLGHQRVSVLILDLNALLCQQFNLSDIQKELLLSNRIATGICLENYLGQRQGTRSDLIIDIQQSRPGIQNDIKNDRSLPSDVTEVNIMMRGQETRQYIANRIGMGRVRYQQGKQILRLGTPALITAVDQHQISISQAARQARLTPQQQLNFLNNRRTQDANGSKF